MLAIAMAYQVDAFADDKISARAFAGDDLVLSELEAAQFVTYRYELPFAKVLKPGETQVTASDFVRAASDKLSDLNDRLGPPPWAWKKVDDFAEGKTSPGTGERQDHSNVTEADNTKVEIEKNGLKRRPRIRRNADELVKDKLDDAKGAAIGFVNNRLLEGSGAWNGEGIIFLPLREFTDKKPSASDVITGPLVTREHGVAIQWNLAETQKSDERDVQELTLAYPMAFRYVRSSKLSQEYTLQARPYLQTDFSGGHRIIGTEVSGELVGNVISPKFHFGSFQQAGVLQYQLRAVPKIDVSSTERVGKYTERILDDDWVRIGGLLSLDLRLTDEFWSRFEVGASYEFFETVKGRGGYVKLEKQHLTWWFTENLGLTAENTEGQTPISDKEIDQFTVLLEVKY